MTELPRFTDGAEEIVAQKVRYNMKTKKSVTKSKKKALLVTNFFVPTSQQVDYQLIGCTVGR